MNSFAMELEAGQVVNTWVGEDNRTGSAGLPQKNAGSIGVIVK